MYAAHAAWLVRKPHIAFDDTYNMEQIRLYEPFTPVILTGDYDHPRISNKEIRYAGYHELSYLHPNYYKPDEGVLKDLGVTPDEKYVLVRFIALNATHDIGNKGVPLVRGAVTSRIGTISLKDKTRTNTRCDGICFLGLGREHHYSC